MDVEASMIEFVLIIVACGLTIGPSAVRSGKIDMGVPS